MKCDTCKFYKEMPENACCAWYMDNVVCGDKKTGDCPKYIPCDKEKAVSDMQDGIYFEVFALKDGVRYNAKIIAVSEVSEIMANSVMDGLGKVIGFEETAYQTKKGGERYGKR